MLRKQLLPYLQDMGKQSVSAWKSFKFFIKFKTAITINQVASSPSIRSIKSSTAMFVNIFFKYLSLI